MLFLVPLGSALLTVPGLEFQEVVAVLLVVVPVVRPDSPDVILSVRPPPCAEFFAVSAAILPLRFLSASTQFYVCWRLALRPRPEMF